MCVRSKLTHHLFVRMYTIVKIYNFMTMRICLHIKIVHVYRRLCAYQFCILCGGHRVGGAVVGLGLSSTCSNQLLGSQGHQNLPQVIYTASACMQGPVSCIPLDSTRVGYHRTSHDDHLFVISDTYCMFDTVWMHCLYKTECND